MGAFQPRYWPLLEEKGLWSRVGPSWAPILCHAGSLRGRDGTPHWADGETGSSPRGLCALSTLCLGSVQPQRLTRDVVLACPLAAAGRHPPPRPELPEVRLPAVRAGKFLLGAIRGPACCCPTSPGLRTVAQTPFSWLPRDPKAAARPAPIAMETACTQFPPSPPPCPKSGPQAGPAPA